MAGEAPYHPISAKGWHLVDYADECAVRARMADMFSYTECFHWLFNSCSVPVIGSPWAGIL